MIKRHHNYNQEKAPKPKKILQLNGRENLNLHRKIKEWDDEHENLKDWTLDNFFNHLTSK